MHVEPLVHGDKYIGLVLTITCWSMISGVPSFMVVRPPSPTPIAAYVPM